MLETLVRGQLRRYASAVDTEHVMKACRHRCDGGDKVFQFVCPEKLMV